MRKPALLVSLAIHVAAMFLMFKAGETIARLTLPKKTPPLTVPLHPVKGGSQHTSPLLLT